MKRSTKLFLSFILLICILLIPPFTRTYKWANNATGLIILSGLCENHLSFNPFSTDSYLIRPKYAIWILLNMDYPYINKDVEHAPLQMPLVNLASAAVDDTCMNTNDAHKLVEHLVKRGEPINEYYHGFTPVHAAILSDNPDILGLLLNLGADPTMKIKSRYVSKHNGMNAYQFAAYLKKKAPDKFAKINSVLDNYKINHNT